MADAVRWQETGGGADDRAVTTTLRSWSIRFWRWISTGTSLPYEVWAQRHRWILILLWLHVPSIFVFALVQGSAPSHALFEASIVGVFAVVATLLPRRHRRLSTVVTSVGLMTSSAVIVHLAHGTIEAHFHYFVMVAVVTLYQDWLPFVVAIVFVVFQHGIAGAIDPHSVYDHPPAVRKPWLWAGIHGGFIVAMSLVGIASWRFNEVLQRNLMKREEKLAEAQEVARLGSWELDVRTGSMVWSDELYRLLEMEPRDGPQRMSNLFGRFSRRDILDAQLAVEQCQKSGKPFARDFHVTIDGEHDRWLHCRLHVSEWDGDEAAVLSGTAQDVTDRKRAEADLTETLSLLTATLDATADGILVVDLEGKITSYNERFVELWRVPRGILEAGDDERALSFVLGQLRDPDAFAAKVRELYARPEAQSDDVIEFLDGRSFERSSMPQRVHGEVVGRVWSFRDITERKRLENELSHQAFHDSLTGLANQALFRDRVEHALERVARQPGTLAVLFVDLDDFKTVNDSLGHTVGDELLVTVADRLRGSLRPSDSAARLGGDEFAILLEDLGPDREADSVADRVLASLQQPFFISNHELFATASIGIAFSADTTSCDQLLRNADLAMYTAKRKGKNRWQIYRAEMHTAALDRLEIEAALRRGLDRGELVVEYQPIVRLPSGSIAGVEALVRWDHPERGLLPPEAFIALAEDAGLVGELGRQVLASACAQGRAWQVAHSLDDLIVSVNVSPRQLQDEAFIEQVEAELASSGLPPETLVIEITETAMMHDTDATLRRLDLLKSKGVRLAVDDFGTGYSSLSYLQRFPIDILKIDRAFVDAIGRDSHQVSLAPAIVSLARTLRLEVIAEGVETPGQVDALTELGCELAQGFHFSEPLDVDGIDAVLARNRADVAAEVAVTAS